MLDKYIKINDKLILTGQYPSTGEWYCKELPAHNPEEMDLLIGKVNIVLNKHNIGIRRQRKIPNPPSKGKGLD